MTMTDPISDMLTRLRNGQMAGKQTVEVPASRLKKAILDVLKTEGFIQNYSEATSEAGHPTINVDLKYHQGKGVMTTLKRVSKPGLRQYAAAEEIPMVANGLGVTIVSTSKGVMTDTSARQQNIGGEVLCQVL